MKRTRDIERCRELVTEDDIDHVHIRKLAMATGFVDDLRTDLEQDSKVVTVEIAEWDYDELMESLHWELRRALPRRNRIVRWVKRIEISARAKWVKLSPSSPEKPDYSKVKGHLDDVASGTDGDLIILVTHNGEKLVDNFSWVPKITGFPSNTTLITHGFQHCELDESKEVDIGRLDENDTVEYLTSEEGMSEQAARETHAVHKGHPVAIDMAVERGQPQQPLSDDALEQLWLNVYDKQISKEEIHLLRNASHLIDLDYRDVAMTVDKDAPECREILQSLENKGIVSRTDSKRFTADRYVKRQIRNQVHDQKLAENHRTSFKHYADKWVSRHETMMQETALGSDSAADGRRRSPQAELEANNLDLFLAAHHLSQAEEHLTIEEYISEIERLDGDNSSLFMFGMYAQRFFFDDPTDVVRELSDALLDVETQSDEFMSDSLDILVGTSIRQYISALSDGWSNGIGGVDFETDVWGNPEQRLTSIQDQIGFDIFESLPGEVQIALVRVFVLPKLPDRAASNWLQMTGKTAQKHGLEEEPFREWLTEVETLLDMLDPDVELEDDEDDQDYIEVQYESLDAAVQDRIELEERLEEHRSEAQRKFQRVLESIRDDGDEIAEQYVDCGDALSETSNPVFPYMWYAFGHKTFADIVLGGKHSKLNGQYMYYLAKREDHEEDLQDDEVIMPIERVESKLS